MFGADACVRRTDGCALATGVLVRRADGREGATGACVRRIDGHSTATDARVRGADGRERATESRVPRTDARATATDTPPRGTYGRVRATDGSLRPTDACIRRPCHSPLIVRSSPSFTHVPPSDDDPPAPSKRKPPRELPPAVRAFLSRKDVWQFVHTYVKRRVPHAEYEQVAQDALMEATANAVWPDTDEEKVRWATLTTVTDRVIADHLTKRRRRREYEGDMPADPTVQDEAGDYVPDEEKDRDPSLDPRVPVPRVEGMIMRRYLAQAVKGKPRDEETLRWMTLWADEERTYDDIARETGLPVTTVSKRVHDFKEEYGPKYERWRNRTILIVLLLAAAVAAYFLLRPRPDAIRPAPDFTWPPPSASSAAPVLPPPPPSFDNALPTQPPDGPKPLK